ncbi:unnamed protein product [Haemonchus placei]|uniref:BAR domain-containing protein n=1 Tax=Haemonchus placei TaxID=6290 RepID=A0A0N4X4M0_HAEPC|nr:unnamed protein product [Haemonchus placei]
MFGIKKLAYQFGRAVGYTDPTALPQQVQARCQDCEGYREALVEACEAMLQIMQGNPAFTPPVNSAQHCECPKGTAPSEMFDKSLESVKGFWHDEEYEDLKRTLLRSKEDLELAQEELKKGENMFRKRTVKKANEKYEADLRALESFLTGTIPGQKIEHLKEIEAMMSEIQSYHEWVSSYCSPLASYKVTQPPNL